MKTPPIKYAVSPETETSEGGRALAEPIFHRIEAVKILGLVLTDGLMLDEAIDNRLAEDKKKILSRFWLTEVCAGTLRWKGRLELVVDSIALSKKPSGFVRKLLLLAAYQILAQDRVPVSRVVRESVEAAKTKEGEALARFTNAVLRKVSEHEAQWKSLPFPMKPTHKDEQAQWASLPYWVWNRLNNQRGLEWAKNFAVQSLERPKLWLKALDPSFESPHLIRGPVAGSFQVREGTTRDGPFSGPVPEWPGFSDGKFFVQDISSQYLVSEMSRKVREAAGSESKLLRVLDLCAAPGGKSASLSLEGFEVYATDQSENRMRLLKSTIERVAKSVKVLPRAGLESLGPYDWVWVDAPCTGTGTLRKHPEIRWNKSEEDLKSLQLLQKSLIEEATSLIPVGGFLAYTVCSVLDDEGRKVVESSSGFKDGFELLGEWKLSPQDESSPDGFYGILLRKK